jgi:adenylate kinase family enzyme
MNKIAVFGKPASGKSTLCKKLAKATAIKLYPLDLIEYHKNGQKKSVQEYQIAHDKILNSENWIIDGLGTISSFWSRLDAADTLIYIDISYWQSYWWANKRLLISPFAKPEGWPGGSSVLKGTIASWIYLRLAPRFWTHEFLKKIQGLAKNKRLYHIKTVKELNGFIDHWHSD